MACQPRYPMEEHARRGRELYHRHIESQFGPEFQGQIIAIDIDTGEFEVGDKSLTAANKLLQRLPDGQIWCERIGYPAVLTFGPRLRANKS